MTRRIQLLAGGVAALLLATVAGTTAAQSEEPSSPLPARRDPPPQPPPAEEVEQPAEAVAPLAARDVIERLKTVRSEIVVEEETIRLLKLKLERMELEQELEAAEKEKKGGNVRPASFTRRSAPVSRPDPEADLVVKFLTLRPFKEAIVTYRGRAYTVRPGDRLGPLVIKDMNESGVVIASDGDSGGQRSVPMGQ